MGKVFLVLDKDYATWGLYSSYSEAEKAIEWLYPTNPVIEEWDDRIAKVVYPDLFGSFRKTPYMNPVENIKVNSNTKILIPDARWAGVWELDDDGYTFVPSSCTKIFQFPYFRTVYCFETCEFQYVLKYLVVRNDGKHERWLHVDGHSSLSRASLTKVVILDKGQYDYYGYGGKSTYNLATV